MPILIGLSPWAKLRIGGENTAEPASAAPALTIPRRVIRIFIPFLSFIFMSEMFSSQDREPPSHVPSDRFEPGGADCGARRIHERRSTIGSTAIVHGPRPVSFKA